MSDHHSRVAAPRCARCETVITHDAAFCPSCGTPTRDEGAPAAHSPTAAVQPRVVPQATAVLGELTKSPLVALLLIGTGVLTGTVMFVQDNVSSYTVAFALQFAISWAAPLVLIATVDHVTVTVDHRLAFVSSMGVMATAHGLSRIGLVGDDLVYQRFTSGLSAVFFIAGGVLLLATVLPQLPPRTSLWSSSESRYIAAPGAILAITLIWVLVPDSRLLDNGFELSYAAGMVQTLGLGALAVVGSLMKRPLRQGVAAALAFVGLNAVLSLLPALVEDVDLMFAFRGATVMGLAAAVFFLPDSLDTGSAVTIPASTHRTQSRSTPQGGIDGPALTPRDTTAPVDASSQPAVDRSPADIDRPSPTVDDRAGDSAVDPDPPEPPSPTTIDAPPPPGPRRG